MTKFTELNLSSPWEIFYREITAMFGQDPQITIDIDREKKIVKLLVDNPKKAEALSKILPATKQLGNITITILVIPSNKNQFYNSTVFDDAFEGNPAYSFAETIKLEDTSNPMTFVVFKKEVVQFFGDNPFASHGQISTLYENIAEDVFDANFCFYSTDVEDK